MVELLNVGDLIKKPTRLLSLVKEWNANLLWQCFIILNSVSWRAYHWTWCHCQGQIREFILEMNKQGVTFILTTTTLMTWNALHKEL